MIIKVGIDQEIILCHGVKRYGRLHEVIALVAVKNILLLGGYQIYFWVQRNHDPKRRILLPTSVWDRWIPALPQAYWVYTPFYYVVFNLAFLALPDYKITVLNAWLMLMHGSFWFFYFPTEINKELRTQVRNAPMDRITRFMMELVHTHDAEYNACPSMHCAFAMFIAFTLYPSYPYFASFFPMLIAVSCLVCKQHLLVDIIPGFAMGALHGWVSILMGQL